ncbi:hypothetical protein [Streptomyces sp. NPDC058861]|uniref:hypothetical protein n=1 Tax=Streptomyces sp. NPDC058861 TaxID=3346653 RepID=UPI0036D108E7
MSIGWKRAAQSTLGATIVAASLNIGTPSAFAAFEDRENMFSSQVCASPGSSTFKFKLYYHSWLEGAYRNFGYSVWSFQRLEDGVGSVQDPVAYCAGTGDGSGKAVKNNAASSKNAHASYSAQIFYNTGFKGAKDILPPLSSVSRLTNTYNNNASFNWSN